MVKKLFFDLQVPENRVFGVPGIPKRCNTHRYWLLSGTPSKKFKIPGVFRCSKVVSVVPNNRRLFMSSPEKKISYFIQLLPEDPGLDLTLDQTKELERLKQHYFWVGKCFRALCGGPDPFKDVQINPKIMELIQESADLLFALWRVIQAGYKVIKVEAISYDLPFPFKTAQELFFQAAYDRAKCEFAICLEDYFEVSTKQMGLSADDSLKRTKEIFEKGTPTYKRNSDTRRYLKTLESRGQVNWFLTSTFLARQACEKAPRKNARLRLYLDIYEKEVDRTLQSIATGSRRRGEWSEVFSPSFIWSNGEKKPWP